MPDKFFYGGQAVIEGVMMRGPHHYAVAVRDPKTKEIIIDRGELKASMYMHPFWKLPFVRGLALMGETIHLGMKSLIWSVNVNAGANDVQIGKREITISVATSAVFGSLIFILLPLVATGDVHEGGLQVRAHAVSRKFLSSRSPCSVRMDSGWNCTPCRGRSRCTTPITTSPSGPSHQAVRRSTGGSVRDVRRASLLHPRCGTGFLLVVLVVSVVLFSLVALFQPNWPVLILSRVVGIPVIAGVSVEAIRWMARHRSNPVVRVLLWPVLATQKFTTREPSDDMLEVAMAAFNAAREGEEAAAA